MTGDGFQGPPDDPSEAPTGQYDYGDYGQPLFDREPTPWHRKPAVLIGACVLIAILVALVIYGIVALNQHGGPTPTTPTTTSAAVNTTPVTSTSPPSGESTAPVAPAPTSTPTSSAATSTDTTTPPTSTSTDDRHHHHHHHDGGTP